MAHICVLKPQHWAYTQHQQRQRSLVCRKTARQRCSGFYCLLRSIYVFLLLKRAVAGPAAPWDRSTPPWCRGRARLGTLHCLLCRMLRSFLLLQIPRTLTTLVFSAEKHFRPRAGCALPHRRGTQGCARAPLPQVSCRQEQQERRSRGAPAVHKS